MRMKVFFVADRPVSLEILKTFFVRVHNLNLSLNFGLLTNPFVSRRFKDLFRSFPFKTKVKYERFLGLTHTPEVDETVHSSIVRFVDSGIFNSHSLDYGELFRLYDHLNADFGAIKDYFRDYKKTIKSAERAVRTFRRGNYSFKLVGVLQGRDLEEYMESYRRMRDMGFRYFAIGGLLHKSEKSNYMSVRDEDLLKSIVLNIKREQRDAWIFVFGSFGVRRRKLLEGLGVWGADYKGWIYRYDPTYEDALREIESDEILSKDRVLVEKMREFVGYKMRGIRRIYRTEEDKKYTDRMKTLVREINFRLSKYGLSLQAFRFKSVHRRLLKDLYDL